MIALALMAACSKAPEAGVAGLPAPANTANVADADVTTNVRTALQQDSALKAFDINVVTLKGDTRLMGVVDSQGQIDTALKLARGADGVHAIHNELTVKP
ncbi:MAG: BON domain-containing protein [Burkholderiales bacterium]